MDFVILVFVLFLIVRSELDFDVVICFGYFYFFAIKEPRRVPNAIRSTLFVPVEPLARIERVYFFCSLSEQKK